MDGLPRNEPTTHILAVEINLTCVTRRGRRPHFRLYLGALFRFTSREKYATSSACSSYVKESYVTIEIVDSNNIAAAGHRTFFLLFFLN